MSHNPEGRECFNQCLIQWSSIRFYKICESKADSLHHQLLSGTLTSCHFQPGSFVGHNTMDLRAATFIPLFAFLTHLGIE